MRKIATFIAGALALAACTSQEDMLENDIRENLASRGNVTEVELTKQDNDHMTGHAVIRVADGTENRLNCTAERDTSKGANYFAWRCLRTIDEAALTAMETTIREAMERQGGRVEQVELTRQDDNNMTGFALVSAGDRRIRTACTATRPNAETFNFTWQCRPEGEAPAAAPAGEGDK
jgi:hypothetical protein